MGVYAQLNSQKKTFNDQSPVGVWLAQQLAKAGVGGSVDPPVPSVAAAKSGVFAQAQSTQTSGNHTLTIDIRQPDGTVESFTTESIAYNLAGGGAANAVHTIAQDATDHTGGTFTLTVTLKNGETFTTAGIAYNANAATIEAAIDTAASGNITGWSAGHISVSGGILQAAGADVVLTFDGASVSGEPSHVLTVFDGSSLTGGSEPATRVTDSTVGVEAAINRAAVAASISNFDRGDITVGGTSVDHAAGLTYTFDGAGVTGLPVGVTLTDVDGAGGAWGAVTETTRGQTERAALGVLVALNVIASSTIADQDAATAVDAFANSGNRNHNVPANVVKALMREAAAEDANNGTYHSLEAALWGAGVDRAPLVQERVAADNTKPA